VQRLRGWGFNATSEYSTGYVLPITLNSAWASTPDHSNPQKMAFTRFIWPSQYVRYDSTSPLHPNSYGKPIKDLMAPLSIGRVFPDIWDPNLALWLQKTLTDPNNGEYQVIHSPHSDYLIGINVDQTDTMYGFGSGADFGTDHTHTHLGWVVLATSPTQTSGTDPAQRTITYTDTTVYSKQEPATGCRRVTVAASLC
jgi:hypothetical protein